MLLFFIRAPLRLANWPSASEVQLRLHDWWIAPQNTKQVVSRAVAYFLSGVVFYFICSQCNVCKKHFYPQCHWRNGIQWVNKSLSVADFGPDSLCWGERERRGDEADTGCLFVTVSGSGKSSWKATDFNAVWMYFHPRVLLSENTQFFSACKVLEEKRFPSGRPPVVINVSFDFVNSEKLFNHVVHSALLLREQKK